jgi:hypothetical protein
MKQQGHAKRKEGGLKPTRRKEVENPQDDTATRRRRQERQDKNTE